MTNICLLSFLLFLATVQADVFSIDWNKETESPSPAQNSVYYYVYLYDVSGNIRSDSIGAVDSAYIWILPGNFSSNSEALIIRIKAMRMSVYDASSRSYYCRRDLLYLGINLCNFDPGTCFVFYPRDTICGNLDQSTADCEKIYWIRHDLNRTHGIILGKPRSPDHVSNMWFEINYSVENCAADAKGLSSNMAKQFDEDEKIVFILGIVLGVVTLLLLVVSIAWCVQSKIRRDAQKPASNGKVSSIPPSNDDDHMYETPQDAYSTAGPLPSKQTKSGLYDTIAV